MKFFIIYTFPIGGFQLIANIFLSQGASGIIFPIIKAEGVRQMFFPATIPAVYRAPPVED